MQKWQKKGLIYCTDGGASWSRSHAQVPVVLDMPSCWRIYYATRNEAGQSSISFIDVTKGRPENILYCHSKPVFESGKIGAFDDCGVMPSSFIQKDDKIFMYYIGWSVRSTIPYHNSIGLAVSSEGNSFKRVFEGPIVAPNHLEPYFTGTSWVMNDEGVFRMWYLSCTRWDCTDSGKYEPAYHIKYAESKDGITWTREGAVAIDYKENEMAIANACVIKELSLYKMWYCYRGGADYRTNPNTSYKIGYAESVNAKEWLRKDEEVDLPTSYDGWDSTMLAYPNVIKHDGKLYLFYNGNGFGKSGFGYAILN